MAETILEKLDGKRGRPRRIRFDLQAIRIAERSLGMGLGKAVDQQIGPTFFITMLWAGLTGDDKNLTYRDVEKLVEKALNKKRFTMRQLQEFLLRELGKSGALTGFIQYDDDEEDEDEDAAGPLSEGSETD